MNNNVTVTVSVSEGTFVYAGERPDGGSKWAFIRKNGKGGPTPRKWRKILQAKRENESK